MTFLPPDDYPEELKGDRSVLFQAQRVDMTTVRLEHRKLEAFGEAAQSVRLATSSERGRGALLEAYADVVVYAASGGVIRAITGVGGLGNGKVVCDNHCWHRHE